MAYRGERRAVSKFTTGPLRSSTPLCVIVKSKFYRLSEGRGVGDLRGKDDMSMLYNERLEGTIRKFLQL